MKIIKKIIKWIWYSPRFVVCFLIKIYQKTLSLDHGPLKRFFPHGYCKFYPTCSQYSCDAVKEYGVIIGLIKGGWRILRCNPWNEGGYDPVKPKHQHHE